MRQMVTGLDFRHMSIRALALHAQRVGRVFAPPGTWTRRIRHHGWLRPRRRLHPPKPRDGVRATRPNELWHIDVTIIKLLDGTRLFLHAAIDNFSRRILAWQLASKLDPTTTCEVLTAAGSHLTGEVPTVVADSGVENVNGKVNALLDPGRLNASRDLLFVRWRVETMVRRFASRQRPKKRKGGCGWSKWSTTKLYGEWGLHWTYRVSRCSLPSG